MPFRSINLFLILFALCLYINCSTTKNHTPSSDPLIFPFPGTSIRAIKAVSETEVHFAGSDGSYGYTKNRGKSWYIDTIKIDGKEVHFRGIEVTEKGTFLMGIGSPAYLIHIPAGSTAWKVIYQENHEKAFYDAIRISEELGVMMGDPTEECLSVVLSYDGGSTWKKLPCDSLPPIEDGVAAFAASNSNIAIQGNHIWLVTGGKKALVYHSPDAGHHWKTYRTPIAEGQQMTGIFACDFKNERQGVIVGGNWNEKADNTASIAITKDGGETWSVPASDQQIGYSSDVAFIPGHSKHLLAVSSEHFMLSTDLGQSWQAITELKPYTAQMVSSTKGWAAGDGFVAFFEIKALR